MSTYFDKARELGQLILESEESIRLADAKAQFNEDPAAKARMDEYNSYQNDVQTAMQSGVMTDEQFQTATKRMTEMSVELKAIPAIGSLVQAENEFNYFVNSVMNVLKVTITGDTSSCGGNCSGGCSGCNS